MRVTTSLAALASGALLASIALVAAAGPAAATDEGALIDGDIFLLANAGGIAANSAADVLTAGDGNTRLGQSVAVAGQCPASAASWQAAVRIPQVGVPESSWAQVPITAVSNTVDADGYPYTPRGDYADKADVVMYLAAHGGAGEFPLIVACRDATGVGVGHFRTLISYTGTTTSTITWSVPAGEFPGGATAATTTTVLTAAAAGADLELTATVSPAAAAGTVTFTDGGTEIGTAAVAGGVASLTLTSPAQGNHSFTASFAPTDAGAFQSSQGTLTVSLGLDAATGQLVLTVPAAPVVDGALTFTVPFDTPVALLGARDAGNTRVTASGAFPTVTVTDTRRDGLLTGWEVNAQSTQFTGTAGTIAAKYLGWTPATPTMVKEGTSPLVTQAGPAVSSYLDSGSSAGLASSALLGRSTTAGRGSTTLNAQLALAIPPDTIEGSYTATVTVTLVSD